ncbi:MAG: ABC transporter permease [Acidobacteriota bacterium]
MSLIRALHAELLKLKRTLAIRMVFVTPLLVATLLFFILWEKRNVGPDFDMWDTLAKISLSSWAVFMMPLLITLETALLNGIDHGEKNWKHIFALPIPRHAVYAAKLIVAQGMILVSTLFLTVLAILVGTFFKYWRPDMANAGAPPFGLMFKQAAMVWLAAWLIIAIHTWISIRWSGFALALGVGMGGVFFAIFATSAKVGKYYPWLLPVNVLSKERMAMALWLGVVGGVVAAVIGCLELLRRDVT